MSWPFRNSPSIMYDVEQKLSRSVIKIMMNFHRNPSIDVFNELIRCDAQLFVDAPTVEELQEDLYIELEGETKKECYNRIQAIKKCIAATDDSGKKIKYCNPHILSWVHAAIVQFPYLIHECSHPLYIDRAIAFADASYARLVEKVSAGIIYDVLDGEKMEKIYKSSDQLNDIADAIDIWYSQLQSLWEFNLLKTGASGNMGYLQTVEQLTKKYPHLMECGSRRTGDCNSWKSRMFIRYYGMTITDVSELSKIEYESNPGNDIVNIGAAMRARFGDHDD